MSALQGSFLERLHPWESTSFGDRQVPAFGRRVAVQSVFISWSCLTLRSTHLCSVEHSSCWMSLKKTNFFTLALSLPSSFVFVFFFTRYLFKFQSRGHTFVWDWAPSCFFVWWVHQILSKVTGIPLRRRLMVQALFFQAAYLTYFVFICLTF